MPKKTTRAAIETHPGIARWVDVYGTVEFGHCCDTRLAIRVLDEGGLVWSGRRSYKSFDAALADCDANLRRLLREEYGDSTAAKPASASRCKA
jgi:hypothetical protein